MRLLIVVCSVLVAIGAAACESSVGKCFFGSSCGADAGSGGGSGGGTGSGSSSPLICAPQASHPETANLYCAQIGSTPCTQTPNCCCESGFTCNSQFQDALGPDHCSFCVHNNDQNFAVLCGAGAADIPNYCPAGTTCVHETSNTNSAIAYGCCPAGMTCSGVQGFDVCKM